jgi:hypothetical protein
MNLLFLLSLLICEWFPSRHPQEQHLLLMFLMQKKLNKLKTLKHKNNKTIKRSSLLSLLCVCVCVCVSPTFPSSPEIYIDGIYFLSL